VATQAAEVPTPQAFKIPIIFFMMIIFGGSTHFSLASRCVAISLPEKILNFSKILIKA